MGVLDGLRRNGDKAASLAEDVKRVGWQKDLLEESLRKLELQMEDEGWRRMGTVMEREFSRAGLDDMSSVSRAMYLSNPLIQRAVNVTGYYTWAQGVTFTATEESLQEQLVTELVDDRGNQGDLFSHQARLLTDVDQMVDGNNFQAMFTADDGTVQIRTIPFEEIREIHHSPDDRQQVRYYRRVYNRVWLDEGSGRIKHDTKEELYPDWRYTPSKQPSSIGDAEVRWDAPIVHLRTGGLKLMQYGVPETYAALDWARAYRRFLQDWHTIVASLARFAWAKVSKGTKLQDKAKLESTITEGDESVDPVRRQYAAGSVALVSEGDELTPIPKSGATTSAEDARPSRMMVGTAMNLPDTILAGDADVGNLATAKTLDRPTELAMRSRQSLWTDHLGDIFQHRAEALVRAGAIPGTMRRDKTHVDLIVVEPRQDVTVEISFPSILEQDQLDVVNSLVAAATLSGKTEAGTIPHDVLARSLMEAVGIEDVEEALEQLDDEEQSALDRAVGQLQSMIKPQEPPQPGAGAPPATPPGDQE